MLPIPFPVPVNAFLIPARFPHPRQSFHFEPLFPVPTLPNLLPNTSQSQLSFTPACDLKHQKLYTLQGTFWPFGSFHACCWIVCTLLFVKQTQDYKAACDSLQRTQQQTVVLLMSVSGARTICHSAVLQVACEWICCCTA